LVALLGSCGLVLIYRWSRGTPAATSWAVLGLLALGVFVVLRAATFHRFVRVFPATAYVWLEALAIGWVFVATWARWKLVGRSA
ncbi:MAG TPA: hypothetical protein VLC09_05230, partial [Polyangiaceae bacterium]|nr:hypothetical protein [Polyangiaceae bacterium]